MNREDKVKLIKGDLNLIFNNGVSVVRNPHISSVKALAECMGMKDLWGPTGDSSSSFFENAAFVLKEARHFLITKDKEGWLRHCKRKRGN